MILTSLSWAKFFKTATSLQTYPLKHWENYAMDLSLILLRWIDISFNLEIQKESFTSFFQETLKFHVLLSKAELW